MTQVSFVRALRESDFPAVGRATIELNGWRILLCRDGGTYLALNDRCSHAASPLSTGRFRHGIVMCPLHGARFELVSGKCIGGANRPVRTFSVRIADDWIEVQVPSNPPGISESPQ